VKRTFDLQELSEPPLSNPASRELVTETVGSICWLAMDAAWMLGWRAAATVLIVPCLLGHLLLFRYTPRTLVAITVTASMNCWLAMNAAWMLGDLWAVAYLLAVAKFFCLTATALLALAFSQSRWRPEARQLLFAGFRRLRLAFQPRPKP
jgi:hypothetical protein